MRKKQFAVLVALALIAGLAGGFLSDQFLAGPASYAQETSENQVVPPQMKMLEAGTIQVLDASGKPRIKLVGDDTLKGGLSHLTLYDKYDRPKLALEVDNEGQPSIAVFDKTGGKRITLELTEDEVPIISMFHADGKQRSALWLGDNGHPILSFMDSNGAPRAILALEADEQPSLMLFAKRAEEGRPNSPKVKLSVGPGGASSLILSDVKGKVIWKAP